MLAYTEQLITKQQLQVGIEAELGGAFGQPVDVLEKRILIGIQTSGEENAFFFRADFCQCYAEDLGGFGILPAR